MIDYTVAMWELAARGEKQGVLYFVAVYMLLVVGYSFIVQLRVRRWPRVQGVLIDEKMEVMIPDAIRSEQNYRVSSLYSYEIDEKKYEGSRVSTWTVVASHNMSFLLKMQLDRIEKTGETGVVVYYNPKKPQKSCLIKPGITGLIVTFALVFAPISFYLSEYHL